jgi:hypothetical protein
MDGERGDEMPEKNRTSFRLSTGHIDMIDEVAAHQGGLTKTRVLEWAIERLHAEIMGAKGKKPAAKPKGKP